MLLLPQSQKLLAVLMVERRAYYFDCKVAETFHDWSSNSGALFPRNGQLF